MEKITSVDDIRFVPGELPLQNLYTAGVAGEHFLRAMKDHGRLLAARCEPCQLVYLPPQLYCGRCFGALSAPFATTGRGVVHTFTVVTHDVDGSPLPEPVLVAVIRIDGTDGGLVHRLGEIEADAAQIGMVVEPVWRPAEERVGSILDIAYFRRAD